MPYVEGAQPETREFLQKIVEILMDYVNAQNDRNEKILEFHHPEEMKTLIDLDIPDQAVPLQQLVIDCATTLKYQVKTGKFIIKCSIETWYLWMRSYAISNRIFGYLFTNEKGDTND